MTQIPHDEVERRMHEALGALAARESASLEPHPDPEELLGFHLGELLQPRREEVEQHIARCPECARVVADFSSFPEIEDEEIEVLSPSEQAQSWRAIESRLVDRREIRGPSELARRHTHRGRRIAPWVLGLAATLAIGWGFGWWMGRFSGANEVVLVSGLHQIDNPATLRGAAEEILIRPEETLVHLLFLAPTERPLVAYRVELLDAERRVVLDIEGRELRAEAPVSLFVPRSRLTSGSYSVRFFDRGSKAPEPIAEFAIEVRLEEM